jgi:hypothetical protein
MSNASHALTRLANLQWQADQVLLQEFSPPAVLVNEQGDIGVAGSTAVTPTTVHWSIPV